MAGKVVKRGTRRKRADVLKPQMAAERVVPKLDETMFQQILEAAYVLQQQNDARRVRKQIDPATTLAEIAETQEQLRTHPLELKASARLIAERLSNITNATGIAIATIRDEHLEYCAAVGTELGLEGASGSIDSNLSAFLREEEASRRFQSSAQWSGEMVKAHEAGHPLLFPIYHEGRISGLLQLSFAESESIQEHEIRSCQVMAGMMGEAIARVAELEWKQALAAERATMLAALERLRPELERLVDPASEKAEIAEASEAEASALLRETHQSLPDIPDLNIRESAACKQCGYEFGEGEMFCGRCGTPRTLDFAESVEADGIEPEAETQMEWNFEPESSAPVAEEEFPKAAELIADPTLLVPEEQTEHFEDQIVPIAEGSSALTIREAEPETPEPVAEGKPELVLASQSTELTPSPFGSASGALKWLKGLEQANSPSRRWLDTHRGDIAIGLSTLVLIVALSGWGSRPVQSKLSNQPRLTLFERMLVGLGVAEPPAVQSYAGNPNVQVWEDVHHALYYCSGSDLFGKTPDGKLTTQRDAQLDQFQPAARKNCE